MALTFPINEGEVNKRPQPDQISNTKVFQDSSYDLLALYCTIVKILFLNGSLAVIPTLISYIEEARVSSKKDLHLTVIRNEIAYYCCIAQLLSERSTRPELSVFSCVKDAEPIFVCGDSHTLATSWQHFEMAQRRFQLIPALVTGLKHWHLRPESRFYPKINFQRVVNSIPAGSKIIFIFGEIDCREGMLKAVEKMRYNNLEEAMQTAADIFITVLETLIEEYEFTAFVHPIIPVLEPTRHVVKKYNLILKKLIGAHKDLVWLNFFDGYIEDEKDDGREIASNFELDGTHLHPNYLVHLQNSLEQYVA